MVGLAGVPKLFPQGEVSCGGNGQHSSGLLLSNLAIGISLDTMLLRVTPEAGLWSHRVTIALKDG